jgi:hypothetical protein
MAWTAEAPEARSRAAQDCAFIDSEVVSRLAAVRNSRRLGGKVEQHQRVLERRNAVPARPVSSMSTTWMSSISWAVGVEPPGSWVHADRRTPTRLTWQSGPKFAAE